MTVSPASYWRNSARLAEQTRLMMILFLFCNWNFFLHLPKRINAFGWKPLIRYTQHTHSMELHAQKQMIVLSVFYCVYFLLQFFRVISFQLHLLHISKTYFGLFSVNLFDSCVFCLLSCTSCVHFVLFFIVFHVFFFASWFTLLFCLLFYFFLFLSSLMVNFFVDFFLATQSVMILKCAHAHAQNKFDQHTKRARDWTRKNDDGWT